MTKEEKPDSVSSWDIKHLMSAVLEGVDCNLTYGQMEKIQDMGFITNLRRHGAKNVGRLPKQQILEALLGEGK